MEALDDKATVARRSHCHRFFGDEDGGHTSNESVVIASGGDDHNIKSGANS